MISAQTHSKMPRFVVPSENLSPILKRSAYVELRAASQAALHGESDVAIIQASLSSLIKTYLPYAYWAGFYNSDGKQLKVGPYQGTLACFTIPYGKGVCGRAFSAQQTIIEKDVHQLDQSFEHIACDPNAVSEIVVPCFREVAGKKECFGVLDIDSTLAASFDDIDKQELEALLSEAFTPAFFL